MFRTSLEKVIEQSLVISFRITQIKPAQYWADVKAQRHENIEKPEALVILHLLGNSQFKKLF